MKNKHYTQCLLEKGNQTQTTWVPSIYAQKGKYIKISNTDGWLVKEVYMTDDSKAVEDRSMDYERTRKASDI